jgi:hypothetical protein
MRRAISQRGHGVLQRRVPERADGGGRGGAEEEGEQRQGGGDTWAPARRQGSGRPTAGAARQGPGRVHPGPVTTRKFPKISTHGMPFSFAFLAGAGGEYSSNPLTLRNAPPPEVVVTFVFTGVCVFLLKTLWTIWCFFSFSFVGVCWLLLDDPSCIQILNVPCPQCIAG